MAELRYSPFMECLALVPYGIVYAIWHKETEKAYVGQTKQALKRRMSGHRSNAKNGKGCELIDRAINKHGIGAFEVFQLAIAPTGDDRNHLEKFFIQALAARFPSGYNLTNGGQHHKPWSGKQSPEWIEKRTSPLRGQTQPRDEVETRAANRRGKVVTGKALENIRRGSFLRRGVPLAPDVVQGMIERANTPEAKARMSRQFKGVPKPAAQRLKMSAAAAKVHTPEHIANSTASRWTAEARLLNGEQRGRDCIVTLPSGEEVEVHNLSRFCRGNGLSHGNMTAVAQGKWKHSKGFGCRYAA